MGCLTANVKGTVASFINPTVTDIESARVYFSPTQLGEGTPSPDNVREIVGRTSVELYHSEKNLAHIIGYSAINSDSNNTRSISNSYGTTINTTEFSLPDTKLVISQSQYPNTSTIYSYANGYIGVLVDDLIWEQKYNVSFKVQDITSNPLNASLQNIRLLVPSGGSYQPEVNGDKLLFKNVVWKPHSTAVGRRNFEICICGMSFALSEFMVTPADDDDNYDFKPYQGKTIPFSWKRLPDEYQEVEYIESDGGQYIDSGIECTNDLVVDFKIYYDNIDNLTVCGGIDNTNSPIYFRHHFSPISTTKIAYWAQYNKINIPSVSVVVSEGTHTIYVDPLNGIYIVDGVRGTFTPIETGKTTGKSYGIFGRIGNTGTIQSKPSRFYYFKFYKNNQMIGNFIPCYRKSDNEIGMYDTVSQTFYTNQGTGTFLKGDDVFSNEVYGGYVDLVTGEVWADHAMFTVDEPNATCTLKTPSRLLFNFPLKYYFSAPSRKGASMCTMLPENASTNWNYGYVDNIFATATTGNHQLYLNYTGDGDGWSELVGEEATVENVKAYLRNIGFAICATLRTPILMRTLTPQQLQTFKNENNIWSDGDSVEIDYDLAETFDIQKAKRKIIMSQPHVESASNSPSSPQVIKFKTDMKAPLKQCIVNFAPIQEGSGDPSPTNVRNITGWTEISVKNGENTYTVDWTDDVGTVYGGYVDLVSGELVAEYFGFTADGENIKANTGYVQSTCYGAGLVYLNGSYNFPDGDRVVSNTYCDTLNPSMREAINCVHWTTNSAYYVVFYVFSKTAEETKTTAEAKNETNEWLKQHPTTVVYKMKEPITYQLTPQQILTFKLQQNIIWNSANEYTDIKYWTRKPFRKINDYLTIVEWTDKKYISATGKITAGDDSASYTTDAIFLKAGTYNLNGFNSYTGKNITYRIHEYTQTDEWVKQVAYFSISKNSEVDVSFTLDHDSYIRLSMARLYFTGTLTKVF